MVSVFKTTTDDWYGSFMVHGSRETIKLVQINFTSDDLGYFIVSAGGNDDYGLEKHYTNEKQAWCCFLEIIGIDDVKIEQLVSLGFKGA